MVIFSRRLVLVISTSQNELRVVMLKHIRASITASKNMTFNQTHNSYLLNIYVNMKLLIVLSSFFIFICAQKRAKTVRLHYNRLHLASILTHAASSPYSILMILGIPLQSSGRHLTVQLTVLSLPECPLARLVILQYWMK